MERINQIKSDAIRAGALQSSGVIVAAIKEADDIHKAASDRALTIVLDYIERMERAPAEVVAWARPHLDNMNSSLLGVVPPNGFPQEHKQLANQYSTVFKQRTDIMLRNCEIGHQQRAAFARAEKVESKEEWISAGEAIRLLKPSLGGEMTAQRSICKRAHAGLVRSHAQRLVIAGRPRDNAELPAFFWWAEGYEALHQNWRTGDFDTWVKGDNLPRELRSTREIHFEAFGVSFLRSDVEKMIPPAPSPPPAPPASNQAAAQPGGRPPADWWEECLIDLCFQHFRGDLQPKTQADIIRAMQDWIVAHGYDAAESTIKIRARKLMDAIKRESEAEN
ncbi:hypothetical protein [Bradyrhizobium sp. CCBAU 25338]|uniref:hypothetical protein n=1 Tax=Bradyrhizobium sp. CCBAU 25338 TaxID=1641877 RepID=UPI0023047AEC|nr:hypothetical protein [Bradyrhizobium sp. CCBAU 25338]